MGFKSLALGNQQRFSCFPNTVSVRFYQFLGNEFYIVDGMSRKTKMIGNSGGLINVMSLNGFLDCASVFTKSVAEMSFCFSYTLHIAFGALYHVYEIGR